MRIIKGLFGLAMCALAQPALAQYAQPPAQAPAGYDRLEQYLWEGAARQNTPDGYRTYLDRYPQGAHADQARDQLDRFAGRVPAQPAPTPYQRQVTPGYSPEAAPYPQPQPEPALGYPQPQQQPTDLPQTAGRPIPAEAAPVEPALPPAPEPAPPPPSAAAPIAPAAVAPAPAVARPTVKGSPLFLCRPVFAGGTPPFEQAGEAEITAYFQALKINSVSAYQSYLKSYPTGVFAPAVNELVATREGRARALAATTVPGPSQAHPRSVVMITPADYPLGATAGGSTTAVWEVAEDGCVQYCRIEKSSGTATLDAATCRTLSARGGYDPARDSAGKPIRSIETGTFTWTPPAK